MSYVILKRKQTNRANKQGLEEAKTGETEDTKMSQNDPQICLVSRLLGRKTFVTPNGPPCPPASPISPHSRQPPHSAQSAPSPRLNGLSGWLTDPKGRAPLQLLHFLANLSRNNQIRSARDSESDGESAVIRRVSAGTEREGARGASGKTEEMEEGSFCQWLTLALFLLDDLQSLEGGGASDLRCLQEHARGIERRLRGRISSEPKAEAQDSVSATGAFTEMWTQAIASLSGTHLFRPGGSLLL